MGSCEGGQGGADPLMKIGNRNGLQYSLPLLPNFLCGLFPKPRVTSEPVSSSVKWRRCCLPDRVAVRLGHTVCEIPDTGPRT